MKDSVPDRAVLATDLRRMALAHAALDEIGVPRENDAGQRLSLFGRIEALRAGKYDPERLSPPSGTVPTQCPTCAVHALAVLDGG